MDRIPLSPWESAGVRVPWQWQTAGLLGLAAAAPLFYLSLPGFFYMLWRCGRAYHEDKRAFEAAADVTGEQQKL